MKLWFNKDKVNFNSFCSEQFLLLSFFKENIVKNCNDFENYIDWAKSISNTVSFTSLEECNYILFPEKLNNNILSYIDKAKRHNKKIIAFYNDDKDAPIALDDTVLLYRTSLNSSKRKHNEFSMPAWSRDFNDYVLFEPRHKSIKPVVSFCGYLSHPLRKLCLEELDSNQNIEKNFIIRDMFWGGKVHDIGLRREYAHNIASSDFVLCTRGAGNFSYRFYETLSAGRIPIFVNSDSILPCDDKINWKNICVFAERPQDINEAIYTFWSSLTENGYLKLQETIREIYLNYISPAGFTKYLSSLYS